MTMSNAVFYIAICVVSGDYRLNGRRAEIQSGVPVRVDAPNRHPLHAPGTGIKNKK